MSLGMELFVGKVVVLELDTMAKHEGVLEDYDGERVKVVNSSEVWWIPVGEIVRIDPVPLKKFTL
jgi:hypothetical protein